MRQVNISVHMLVVLGVMLCSQWLTTRPVHAQNCVDVLALADNTMLGNVFMRNNFTFHSLGGLVPFVNVFLDLDGDPVHGVQFSNQGLEVLLPAPSNQVDMRARGLPYPAGDGASPQRHGRTGKSRPCAGQ